jgi:hypothetical protein
MQRKKHSSIRSFEHDLRVRELIAAGVIENADQAPKNATPTS